jgi:hypothetical protein
MNTIVFFLFDSSTRATLRLAELGFLGESLNTRTQSAFFWGEPISAFVLFFFILLTRKETIAATEFFNTKLFFFTLFKYFYFVAVV